MVFIRVKVIFTSKITVKKKTKTLFYFAVKKKKKVMLSAKYVQTTRAVYVDNDIANVKAL